jgi:hypothetical protein
MQFCGSSTICERVFIVSFHPSKWCSPTATAMSVNAVEMRQRRTLWAKIIVLIVRLCTWKPGCAWRRTSLVDVQKLRIPRLGTMAIPPCRPYRVKLHAKSSEPSQTWQNPSISRKYKAHLEISSTYPEHHRTSSVALCRLQDAFFPLHPLSHLLHVTHVY